MKHHNKIFEFYFCMLAGAILAMVFTACQSNAPVQEASNGKAAIIITEVTLTEEQFANADLKVEAVAIASVNKTILLNGSIDVPPQNMVSVSFPLGGYLRNIHLLPGEHVAKGQVIAIMEDASFVQLQQDYLVSSARLNFLEKELQRQQSLAATEASSKKNLQQVESDWNAERANHKGLEEKLALIGIKANTLTNEKISRSVPILSPINGFVSKVNVNVGRYVNPTEILIELIDPTDIHASLIAYEKDIPFIQKDQPVRVRLLNNSSTVYPADVLLVSRNLDEDRAGMVHCHFDRYDPALMPGMFISAEVEVGRQILPAVPEAAIVRYQGKHFVFVEKAPRKFQLTEVEVGDTENGITGLAGDATNWANQRIVTRNAFSLLGMLKNGGEE